MCCANGAHKRALFDPDYPAYLGDADAR